MARHARPGTRRDRAASSATHCANRRRISANSFRSKSGKIIAEGKGEVQEMIDICDFAVGQSRHALWPDDSIRAAEPSLDGAVASARARRRHFRVQFSGRGLVVERGPGRPSAATPTIWKPSEKTPLTAIAVTKIAERVCRATGADPAIFLC